MKESDLVMKEFKDVRGIVEHFLATDELCRNSDKWLLFRVFQYLNDYKIPLTFNQFKKVPYESVRRVRQKIQNQECRFLPTKVEVLKKRKLRQYAIRNWSVGGGLS